MILLDNLVELFTPFHFKFQGFSNHSSTSTIKFSWPPCQYYIYIYIHIEYFFVNFLFVLLVHGRWFSFFFNS